MPADEIRPDPTALRGLAHPLRVRLLDLLREHGPATATGLATRLGQSTGATSYHLRQLARYGFVVDEPGRAVGRERWWRAAHRNTVLDGVVGHAAPAAAETYLRAVAAMYADRIDRWLGELPALPSQWSGAPTLSDWRLRLTPAEATELHGRIGALLDAYRRDEPGVGAPPDAATVVVQAQLMPFLGVPPAAETDDPPAEEPLRPAPADDAGAVGGPEGRR
ncbi:winged helix-turn-helix domain-containing protein [Micromonospora sp. NPDC048909]|uniref:winged helix-turn-helix domain-containing protein n=1 Tax=Micromonospora sp. NPDC048909 TaxID=3155643 RepID=UPI0033DE390F